MNDKPNLIPVVSRPQGNVDERNLICWLAKNHPDTLTQPENIQSVKCFIGNDEGFFVITPYATPDKSKYLKVNVKWEIALENELYHIHSTLYTIVPYPQNPENLRQMVLAKTEVLMLAQTYIEHVMAIVDPRHERHVMAAQNRQIFQMMKYFSVETTPTGRVRKFIITTQEGRRHEATRVVTPYFKVSQIDHYEAMTMIQNGGEDSIYLALRQEEAGHLNRNLVEYYTWCGKRYGQTFEEAYTRLIDIVADDHVQTCLIELQEMERGVHEKPIHISEIRKKYNYMIRFLSRGEGRAKFEFMVMEECYDHIQELIAKFDSWREHPELSLAQTSLIERKIDELSQGLGQKRTLINELRRRFDGIEYWARWLKEQFPTLFRIMDQDES